MNMTVAVRRTAVAGILSIGSEGTWDTPNSRTQSLLLLATITLQCPSV